MRWISGVQTDLSVLGVKNQKKTQHTSKTHMKKIS